MSTILILNPTVKTRVGKQELVLMMVHEAELL